MALPTTFFALPEHASAQRIVFITGACLALTLACAGNSDERSTGTNGGGAIATGGKDHGGAAAGANLGGTVWRSVMGASAGTISNISSSGPEQPTSSGGARAQGGTSSVAAGGTIAASGTGDALVGGAASGGVRASGGGNGTSNSAGGAGGSGGTGGAAHPSGGIASTAIGTSGTGAGAAGGRANTAAGSGGTSGAAHPSGGGAGATCAGTAIGATDGVWSGTTNDDNRPLKFLIAGGQMSFLSISWGKVSCGATEGTTNIKAPSLLIASTGALTGTLTSSVHVSINCVVTGQFCGNTVSGVLDCKVLQGDCTGAFTSNFGATRVSDPPSCGNDVEWPEQCDDGNLIDNDGCSSACLLEGTAEKEPNDDGVTAVGEDDFTATPTGLLLIQSNTTVTASLSLAGDEDMFRAFGTSSTTTTRVRIETFGRKGPGTCDVDTVLDLRDSAGQVLALDDDSGIGACSSIEYVIPAAFPIAWVNIHVADKNDDDAIGLYFLVVTYL